MPDKFKEDSPSVQAHLGIMQAVINRMASNSTSCKAWCITLVSAVLVIVADKGKPQFTLIALIPTLLFCSLDAYYLALEKRFRKTYTDFINKLHGGNIQAADLYYVTPSADWLKKFFAALWSFSVWPFYVTLIAMILVVKVIVMAPPTPQTKGMGTAPVFSSPSSSATHTTPPKPKKSP